MNFLKWENQVVPHLQTISEDPQTINHVKCIYHLSKTARPTLKSFKNTGDFPTCGLKSPPLSYLSISENLSNPPIYSQIIYHDAPGLDQTKKLEYLQFFIMEQGLTCTLRHLPSNKWILWDETIRSFHTWGSPQKTHRRSTIASVSTISQKTARPTSKSFKNRRDFPTCGQKNTPTPYPSISENPPSCFTRCLKQKNSHANSISKTFSADLHGSASYGTLKPYRCRCTWICKKCFSLGLLTLRFLFSRRVDHG